MGDSFMHISKIIIENFRNLNNFEIELNEGLNVILGKNNVGKSNLIAAIRIALNSFYDSIEPITLSKEDVYKNEKGEQNFSKPIKITIEFQNINTIGLQAEFQSILNANTNLENQTAKIIFSWLWNEKTKRYTRGWSGGIGDTVIDLDIFQALPVTFLGALRDALRHVSPGRKNYFSELFAESLENEDEKLALEIKIQEANTNIATSDLVSRVKTSLNGSLERICGTKSFKQEADIETSEANFDQIIKNLKITLKGRVKDLSSNGLGYNNLICIAVILSKLCQLIQNKVNPQLPFLLIEEPEAHLHPQLQTLLAENLGINCTSEQKTSIQVIVTSHSAVIASQVKPELLHIMHKNSTDEIKCFSLHKSKPSMEKYPNRQNFKKANIEWNKLKRIIDVTKATMFFADGIILVEGITEAMLIPVLAKKMNIDLKQHGISVIPCGVAFNQIASLFKEGQLEIPISIITDADPQKVDVNGEKITKDTQVNGIFPKGYPAGIEKCDRLKFLEDNYNNGIINVFASTVTFEYDLIDANKSNKKTLMLIYKVWERLHSQKAPALKNIIKNDGSKDNIAIHAWRDICLGCENSKAEFSHGITDSLDEYNLLKFTMPSYIEEAIMHVKKEG